MNKKALLMMIHKSEAPLAQDSQLNLKDLHLLLEIKYCLQKNLQSLHIQEWAGPNMEYMYYIWCISQKELPLFLTTNYQITSRQ